ncbi:hypothetical protein ACLMJK_000513 [Lecanora helva]
MADPSTCPPLTRSSITAAHARIKPHIHRTPVLTSTTLSDIASTPQRPEALVGTPWEGQPPARPKIRFFFKCENFQRVGAFKVRGAFHALTRLSEEERGRGVVTHSSGNKLIVNEFHNLKYGLLEEVLLLTQSPLFLLTGNHAQALSLAALTHHIPAHIVMPTISTPSKIAATRNYGARIYFSGSTSQEREAVVVDVIKDTGAVLVPPYDHPDIVLGQGTMGLEMEEQVAEMLEGESVEGGNGDEVDGVDGYEKRKKKHLDALIAPLGGGGMLSGLATYFHPTPTHVFGAEPSHQGADDGRRGLLNNKRIPHVSSLTVADGLRTPVGEIPWSIISNREYVRGVYSVSDELILQAMRLVWERVKVVVEPSACVGVAVALFDEGFRGVVEREGGEEGWGLGVVLSGGNVGVEAVRGLFSGEGEGEEEGGNGVERAEGKVGMEGERVAEDVAG